MSNEQEKINRWFKQHPWNHQTFFNRPHATRRHFMELMGAGVTASLPGGASGEGARSGHRGSDHEEHGAERHFHSDGRRPQPHRYLRPEGRQRQYGAGGPAQARNRQRHLLPDRPDAEAGQPDGQFRHRAQRAGARRGSLGVPDLGADRTQSAGRAGQHRAEYRQHRGGGEVSAAQTVRHLPHVPGAELRRWSEPGLPFGQVRAVQSGTRHHGHQQHHQQRQRRSDPLREPLQAAQLAGRQPAHQRSQRRAHERLQRVLHRRQGVDVQPDGESIFRLPNLGERCATAPRVRATPCWWPRRC